MREIVLDTETTGFEPSEGDRIVEIGAIELVNHMPTGRTYHQYINPKRSMPLGAYEIHGIGPDLREPPEDPKPGQVTLRDKPVFADIAQAFVDFVGDAKLVIHNAAFDMKFINHHLTEMGSPAIPATRIIDSLTMARQKFPGSPASLDALCKRFHVDNSSRTLHGALLDSEILAEVYLELLGGRQTGLTLGDNNIGNQNQIETLDVKSKKTKREPRLFEIPVDELSSHAVMIDDLGAKAMWKKA